jgi:hypothetical protein
MRRCRPHDRPGQDFRLTGSPPGLFPTSRNRSRHSPRRGRRAGPRPRRAPTGRAAGEHRRGERVECTVVLGERRVKLGARDRVCRARSPPLPGVGAAAPCTSTSGPGPRSSAPPGSTPRLRRSPSGHVRGFTAAPGGARTPQPGKVGSETAISTSNGSPGRRCWGDRGQQEPVEHHQPEPGVVLVLVPRSLGISTMHSRSASATRTGYPRLAAWAGRRAGDGC